MLDSTITMLQIFFALIILFFQESTVTITAPVSTETLRGQVDIKGKMNIANFASAELAFAYASDQTSTWFTIQTFSTPLPEGEGEGVRDTLATWDTTKLTDDDYTLRLRVYLTDGTFQEFLVRDLKIRNDVPLSTETATLPAEVISDQPLPTLTSIPVTVTPIFPTPTSLPTNPAALAVPYIYSTFGRGAVLVLVLFFIAGLFLRLRRI
jgi:hypothetical protein